MRSATTHGDVLQELGLPVPLFAAEAYVAGSDAPTTITAAELRGSWVVLVVYRRDFEPLCAGELQAFATLASGFAAESAVLVAASTDSYLCHRAWIESHPLLGEVRFPVLADPAHRLASDYGVLGDDGSARPATFLIDPDGVLAHASLPERDDPRDPAETLRVLQRVRRG